MTEQQTINVKPSIHWQIRQLVRQLVGNDGIGRFYKVCYKGSDCGVSIGFIIDNETVWSDELYEYGNCSRKFWHDHTISGIAICGYVEGSEVELSPAWFTDSVTKDEFFSVMDTIDKEAAWYWERDNSQWFYVDYTPVGEDTKRYYGKNTWGEIEFDQDVPKYVQNKVLEYFNGMHYDGAYDKPVALGLGIWITEYINDGVY